MKKLCFLLALAALFIGVCATGALTQELIYISDPTISDTPKMLPRSDASLWNMDFRCNPALLKLDCPYEFIFDTYYLGGYHKKDTRDYAEDAVAAPVYAISELNNEYILNVGGGDVGFALKLTDRANLAFILNYRYGNVLGDGSFSTIWQYLADVGLLYGTMDQRLDSHTVFPSVLFSYKASDAFTVGFALRYAYINERFRENIEGIGQSYIDSTLYPELLLIDRELCLSYHYISPKVGISFTPSDRFVLNASLAAGFYFGGVNKDATLYDDAFAAAIDDYPYTEDLHSSGVRGWDIAAKVRPEFHVSEAVSIPLVLDFWYKNFRWDVGGLPQGYFAPLTYGGVFQGPGTIDYENETTTWDVTAGGGVKYDAGWATLTGMLSNTHWYFNNRYDQCNLVTDDTFDLDGLTTFSQDDTETRDILSLAFVIAKEFSPKFSADFGIRYDIGWTNREYNFTYMSPYETDPGDLPLYMRTKGCDVYQDLTLTLNTTFVPVERFTIALGTFVTIPLDPIDYGLEGSAAGWPPGTSTGYRIGAFEGPVYKDYRNCGWEYGGLLSISYEFGCPVVVPPVTPPPVIEPKIEPMSKK